MSKSTQLYDSLSAKFRCVTAAQSNIIHCNVVHSIPRTFIKDADSEKNRRCDGEGRKQIQNIVINILCFELFVLRHRVSGAEVEHEIQTPSLSIDPIQTNCKTQVYLATATPSHMLYHSTIQNDKDKK